MAYQGNYPPSTPLTSSQIAAGAVQPSNLSTQGPNWDGSGNVGIGTSSPVGKLDLISGTARMYFSNQSATAFFTAVNTTNTAYAPMAINGSELILKTGDAERMRIDSSGNVGVGTSSPGSRLDVVGASGGSTVATVRSADGNMARLNLNNTNRLWSISNYGTQFSPNGAFNIADETAAAVRLAINSSGNVTTPAQPFFKANFTNLGDQTYTNTVLPFNVVNFNTGNHYNGSTYRFTAPVSGNYLFMVECYGTSSAGSATMYVTYRVNGSDIGYARGDTFIGNSAGQVAIAPISNRQIVTLSAGDYIDCYATAYNGSSVFRIFTGLGFFTGYLLG